MVISHSMIHFSLTILSFFLMISLASLEDSWSSSEEEESSSGQQSKVALLDALGTIRDHNPLLRRDTHFVDLIINYQRDIEAVERGRGSIEQEVLAMEPSRISHLLLKHIYPPNDKSRIESNRELFSSSDFHFLTPKNISLISDQPLNGDSPVSQIQFQLALPLDRLTRNPNFWIDLWGENGNYRVELRSLFFSTLYHNLAQNLWKGHNSIEPLIPTPQAGIGYSSTFYETIYFNLDELSRFHRPIFTSPKPSQECGTTLIP